MNKVAARFVGGKGQRLESCGFGWTRVAVAANPRQNPQRLLNDADRALYEAKWRRKVRYEVFDASMSADSAQRLRRVLAEHEPEWR